jgi:enamine deaminase RidA (YjgF/YER057c/UK114 family)
MSIERLTTNPAAGFADAVTTSGAGRTIYVSGNVGFGSEGKVVEGGMGAEAEATFDNIERVLEQAGADFSQIVKINAFITDLDEYADYAARQRDRAGRRPARRRAHRDRRRRLRSRRLKGAAAWRPGCWNVLGDGAV